MIRKAEDQRIYWTEMFRRPFALFVACTVGALMTIGTFLIAGMIPFWLACILAIGGLVGVITSWRRPGSGLVWSLALTVYALSGVLPWPAPWLVRDAGRIAGNTPYCIQVAEDADYRQASSWMDFSPSIMHAMIRSNHAMQFHAILAVGTGPDPAVYNWSYRTMSWKNETWSYATPVVSCVPRPLFAANLPYLAFGAAHDSDLVHLRLVGRSFTVPASYQPKAHASDNPYLMLAVDLLRDAPSACRSPSSCMDYWVTFYLSPSSVMSWLDGPTTEATRVVDERTVPDGAVRTRIDCYPAGYNGARNCTQHFLFDGVLFHFRMREADFDDWRLIQSRLIAMFRDLQTSH